MVIFEKKWVKVTKKFRRGAGWRAFGSHVESVDNVDYLLTENKKAFLFRMF